MKNVRFNNVFKNKESHITVYTDDFLNKIRDIKGMPYEDIGDGRLSCFVKNTKIEFSVESVFLKNKPYNNLDEMIKWSYNSQNAIVIPSTLFEMYIDGKVINPADLEIKPFENLQSGIVEGEFYIYPSPFPEPEIVNISFLDSEIKFQMLRKRVPSKDINIEKFELYFKDVFKLLMDLDLNIKKIRMKFIENYLMQKKSEDLLIVSTFKFNIFYREIIIDGTEFKFNIEDTNRYKYEKDLNIMNFWEKVNILEKKLDLKIFNFENISGKTVTNNDFLAIRELYDMLILKKPIEINLGNEIEMEMDEIDEKIITNTGEFCFISQIEKKEYEVLGTKLSFKGIFDSKSAIVSEINKSKDKVKIILKSKDENQELKALMLLVASKNELKEFIGKPGALYEMYKKYKKK